MTQRLSLVQTVIWLALLLSSCVIAFVVGWITGTFDKPIQELPIAFWLVLLAIIMLGCLPFILVRKRPSVPPPVPKSSIILSLVVNTFCTILFVLMALFNNLWMPNHGANIIFFALVGIENFVLAISNYRRLRLVPQT
jgi:hypothetical protein